MGFFFDAKWKTTALGSPIALFASDSLDALESEHPILVIGGVHGDEPEGVRLAKDTLEWLKSHTPADELVPWILIPCLNVDGFKNKTRVNGRKVDLNRNYPSRDWSPVAKAERYFPGASPGSEPEVEGIVQLVLRFKPRLIIHCHSWKPCIVGTGPRAEKDALRLSRNSGYEMTPEIGYPTPGSLSRFGWHDNGIPVICIEEQDGLKDLGSIWPRFSKAMKEIFTDLSEREADGVVT
jgi:hypothetical protein